MTMTTNPDSLTTSGHPFRCDCVDCERLRKEEWRREAQEAGPRTLREAAEVFEWAGDDEDYAAFRQWLRDRADTVAAQLQTL